MNYTRNAINQIKTNIDGNPINWNDNGISNLIVSVLISDICLPNNGV